MPDIEPDNNPAPEQPEQPAPPAPEPEQPENPETPEGEQPDADADKGGESKLSREEALAELARVRQEAASRRTELRDVQAKLASAKTPEEFAAVQGEVATLSRQILVRDLADEFGLPKELRDSLKGETEEELKAHAEILKKFVPAKDAPPPPRLGGGLDPTDEEDDEDSYDPKVLAAKTRRPNRFR